MADSLSVIPECRREAPLRVHGVVLFPAAPGGSVVHVDAAEYVRWLCSRVVTLRSQLALCRAALPSDVQDAVDALNFGAGNSETMSIPSIPSRPSSVLNTNTSTEKRPSAFTAIESRPSVFKPFGGTDEIREGDTDCDRNGKIKVPPLLRRIFDRSHSSKNTGIGSDEASEIEPPSSNFDHLSSIPRVASEVTASGNDTRRRRRRSISLDNFSRNLILVDSPVSTNTTPAQNPNGNLPPPITLNTLPRARTSNSIHRLAGSSSNNYVHSPKVLCPIAKRAHSNNTGVHFINNSISNNNISNDSYSGGHSSDHSQSSSDIDINIETDDEEDSEHFAEPVDDDDECYSDGGSINPELATVASHLHLDIDNSISDGNNSGEDSDESDIDSISDFNPDKIRSHSDGAALTSTASASKATTKQKEKKHHGHGGERKRRVPTNLNKSTYFPVATSSIDSVDRTSAAAEALARRTSMQKPRRSFSMEHFKRDSTPNASSSSNTTGTGGDNVPISSTNIFLNGTGRRASLADHIVSKKENNAGSWKDYLFGTRLGKRSTFPRESSMNNLHMKRATSGATGAERERSGTPFQPRVSIGSRSRSSVRSSWKTSENDEMNKSTRRDISNASRNGTGNGIRDRERENNNINIEIDNNNGNVGNISANPARASHGHGKKGIKLGSLFRFQSKYS